MDRSSSAGADGPRRFGVVAVLACALAVAVPGRAVAAPTDPGSVSGRVVNTSLDAIGGICVNVGPSGPRATTAADGTYVVQGIDPGDHTVQFVDCNPAPIYVTSWYRGHLLQDQADTVTVPANTDVALTDVTLAAGVAVSGTVTDSSGSIGGINLFVNPYDGPGPSTGTQTLTDGTYRTGPLPDGDYRVQFDDPNDGFANQYWKGHPVWNDADRLLLHVGDGNERPGIDASLTQAATITGIVTGDAGPQADICVNANTPLPGGGWGGVGNPASTADDGTYTLTALPPSIDLRIQFRDCAATPSHVEQWWNGAPDFTGSTSLALQPGEVHRGIDAHLATGIRVAGTVIDTDRHPLADIDVNVNPDGQGVGGYGRTDGSGHYVTSAVMPGRYRVQFRDNSSSPTWAAVYWNQQPTFGTATLLELTAGIPQRDGVDAQLALAASISGTITNSSGVPIRNICVDGAIDTPNGPDGVGQVQTAADGSYTLAGLPAMPVKVRAQDCNVVGPYRTLWWPAADSYQAATAIPLTPGRPRQDVDFTLPPAATISGTVHDDSEQALAGICVQAVTADAFGALTQTGSDGTYQLLLNAGGDYAVQFVDCTAQPTHTGQTRSLSVVPGNRITGIDAVLAPGAPGSVSGSIRNGHGVAVTGACPVVYLANQYAVFGQVAADGRFTVSGVPAGTYALGFVGCEGAQPSAVIHDPVDPASTYQAQWWHGVDLSLAGTTDGGPDPIAQGATLITVTPGGALSGFDQCFGCTPPPTTTPRRPRPRRPPPRPRPRAPRHSWRSRSPATPADRAPSP
jgi:Carboxypeptidase regulatory-like domain